MASRKKIVIIGGGIVGLTVARQLSIDNPELNITVLEKESDIGRHQTSHNSGVMHSGIYYAPGSLKDTLCREGVKELSEYCLQKGIRTKTTGKLIVATDESETASLETLQEWAGVKQMKGIRLLSRAELKSEEPEIEGLKALLVPDVKLVNFQEVAYAIREDFKAAGGVVECHQHVISIDRREKSFIVHTEKQHCEADYLINCAGLYCDKIARMCGSQHEISIVPFRGEYYDLTSEWAKRIGNMIYPAPNPKLPFLGIHLTPTVEGGLTAGPNAVLALGRESYKRSQANWNEVADILGFSGFWKMTTRFWQNGITESMQSTFKDLYVKKVKRYLPALKPADLSEGMSGVRAQAVTRGGTLAHDFLYEQKDQEFHLLNAPSPAATSSLAIAKRLSDLITPTIQ